MQVKKQTQQGNVQAQNCMTNLFKWSKFRDLLPLSTSSRLPLAPMLDYILIACVVINSKEGRLGGSEKTT